MYKLLLLGTICMLSVSNIAPANAQAKRSYLSVSRQEKANANIDKPVIQGNIDGGEEAGLLSIEDFPEEEDKAAVLTVTSDRAQAKNTAYRGAFDTFAERQTEFQLFIDRKSVV